MRFALRSLLKHPGFTTLAVISLAAGLGLITALASLADAILFHPLPVANPSKIVRVYTISEGQPLGLASYPDFADFRRAAGSVAGLIAQSQILVAVGDLDAPGQVRMGLAVTPDYFDVLGVPPAWGRIFRASDAREPVAVLAYDFWESHYGGRRNVMGRRILLSGSTFTVIGVAAKGFGLDRFSHEDFYVPMEVYAAGLLPSTGHPLEERGRRYLSVYGRLARGSTQKRASAEFATLAARLETEYPETNRGRRALVLTEFQARTQSDRTMPALAGTLLGVAVLILGIVSANVAGLMLMRTDAKVREVALRLAIGSGRAALFLEAVMESLLLTGAGAILGLPLAWIALRVLASTATWPTDLRFSILPRFDVRVGLVLLSVITLVTLICGIAPMLAARRIELSALLKSRAHGPRRASGQWRAALMIAEIALASLLIGSGAILAQAIASVGKTDLGYRTGNILVMALDPAQLRYTEARTRAFYDALVERVREVPGVRDVALAQSVPLGYTSAQRQIEIDGEPDRSTVWMNIAGNGYFDVMELPLVSGRSFDRRDTKNSLPVVVVNEELARRCGISGRIRLNGRSLQVIGVARNAKYFRPGEPARPYFYLPWSQNYTSRMFLHVHVPPAGRTAVLAAAQAVEPTLPISEVRWLDEYLTQGATFHARVALEVIGAVGLCGLALATAGLYGVIANSVTRRRREIGLRVALGAKRHQIVVMIVWHGGRLVVAGSAGGIAGALELTRTLASLVGGTVHPHFWTLAFSAAFVILVGLAACLIPAWRGSAIEPACLLREE